MVIAHFLCRKNDSLSVDSCQFGKSSLQKNKSTNLANSTRTVGLKLVFMEDDGLYCCLSKTIRNLPFSEAVKYMNYLRQFFDFLSELVRNQHILIELTKRDFKSRYLGSYLGMLWAFVHPTIYISILWFVFQVGLKTPSMDNAPFILWMMTGLIPWFFFSESLASATNAILENSFLVKKVVFSMGMLPLVKIFSGLLIHLFFIVVIFIMLLIYGYTPSLYNLQVFYYLFATIVLLLGLSWLTSSLVIFLRDVSQIVAMVMQFAFWMTPLVWSAKILPPKLHNLLKLNPVYYLVQGYREAFLSKIWFWEKHYMWSLYFWAVTGIIFVLGAVVFRRLRPHFADVL